MNWKTLRLRRMRKEQFNALQRRKWRRAFSRIPESEREAFCYYSDPRDVQVPRKQR